jgi:hypothetical protein
MESVMSEPGRIRSEERMEKLLAAIAAMDLFPETK